MTSKQKNFGEGNRVDEKSTAPSHKAKGFLGKMFDKLDKAMVKKANSSSCYGGGSGKSKCC